MTCPCPLSLLTPPITRTPAHASLWAASRSTSFHFSLPLKKSTRSFALRKGSLGELSRSTSHTAWEQDLACLSYAERQAAMRRSTEPDWKLVTVIDTCVLPRDSDSGS